MARLDAVLVGRADVDASSTAGPSGAGGHGGGAGPGSVYEVQAEHVRNLHLGARLNLGACQRGVAMQPPAPSSPLPPARRRSPAARVARAAQGDMEGALEQFNAAVAVDGTHALARQEQANVGARGHSAPRRVSIV